MKGLEEENLISYNKNVSHSKSSGSGQSILSDQDSYSFFVTYSDNSKCYNNGYQSYFHHKLASLTSNSRLV